MNKHKDGACEYESTCLKLVKIYMPPLQNALTGVRAATAEHLGSEFFSCPWQRFDRRGFGFALVAKTVMGLPKFY